LVCLCPRITLSVCMLLIHKIVIIISDLVPLRQRGNYTAVVLAIYGIGTTLGPFIGGKIVETTTWRWVNQAAL
jgi:MFS family permease